MGTFRCIITSDAQPKIIQLKYIRYLLGDFDGFPMEISPSRALILIIVVVRVTIASIPLASELGSLQMEYGVPKVSESVDRILSGVAGAFSLSS